MGLPGQLIDRLPTLSWTTPTPTYINLVGALLNSVSLSLLSGRRDRKDNRRDRCDNQLQKAKGKYKDYLVG